jgi:hypothetical protein
MKAGSWVFIIGKQRDFSVKEATHKLFHLRNGCMFEVEPVYVIRMIYNIWLIISRLSEHSHTATERRIKY